jgi:hypothetical protein
VKEYDIFLPLRYNDGRHIESGKFQQLQQLLLTQFDGLTYFPQANQGFWKLGDVTYHDEIVIIRVLTSDSPRARRVLRELKERLKTDFDQEEILIVERDVNAL